MHRLAALRRQWQQHPPVHKLLAAFIGYTGAPAAAPHQPTPDDDTPAGPGALGGVAAAVPVPQDVRDRVAAAETPLEAIAHLERVFFGDVKNVEEL